MKNVCALLSALALLIASMGEGAAQPGKTPGRARPSGRAAALAKKLTELEKLSAQNRSLQLSIQQLQIELNKVKALLKAQGTAQKTHPELLKRLDAMEARLKAASERVAAVSARQADFERRQAARASAQPAPSATGWRAGYTDGFFIASPTNRFRLKIDGFVRTLYALYVVYPERRDVTALDPSRHIDKQGLQLLGARLRFTGHLFSPRIRYALSLEAAYSPHLRIASLTFKPWDFMEVTVGQFKVPDSYQYLKLSGWMLFTDRAAATLGFASGHDIGALVTFRQWKARVFQQVGVFNGSGANAPNDNLDLLYLVRFGVEPFGRMPVTEDDVKRTRTFRLHGAVSGSYNLVRTGDTDGDRVYDDNKAVYKVGVELAVAWKGLSAQAEFFYRVEDHGKTVSPEHCPAFYSDNNRSCDRFQKYWGVYAQTGYYVWKGLQLAARYSYADVFDKHWGRSGSLTAAGAVARSNGLGGLAGGWARSWYSPLAVAYPSFGPRHVHEATGAVLYDLGTHFNMAGHRLRVGLEYTSYWELGWRVEDATTGFFTDEDRQVHGAKVFARVIF